VTSKNGRFKGSIVVSFVKIFEDFSRFFMIFGSSCRCAVGVMAVADVLIVPARKRNGRAPIVTQADLTDVRTLACVRRIESLMFRQNYLQPADILDILMRIMIQRGELMKMIAVGTMLIRDKS
jgi:hypothetical protein